MTTGSDHVIATVGNPTCNGAACAGTRGPGHSTSQLFVYVDDHVRDTGVVALGTAGNDKFSITMACDGVHVTTHNGAPITAGPGCAAATAGVATEVVCTIDNRLNYVLAWGDNGDDEITIGNGFPDDMTSIADGGEGSDILRGGDGQDILFTGTTGEDQLIGNDGDDALLSLSYPSQHNLMGYAFTAGADSLDGGDGNDQLVTDYICAGHFYRGGPGNDIAGFARTGDHPIHAQLGGPSSNPMPYHAHAFNTDLCPDFIRFGTWIDTDLESLEGSLGDDTHNVIWGRAGNDTILGQGGDDELDGDDGTRCIHGRSGIAHWCDSGSRRRHGVSR